MESNNLLPFRESVDMFELDTWHSQSIEKVEKNGRNSFGLQNRLKKILFPNKQFSSLYNPIAYDRGINLSLPDIRNKIEYTQKKRCP